MTLPQHWVPSLEGVRPGQIVAVEGEEAHHAVVVRRMRVGEEVRLGDGVGGVVVGPIVEVAKRSFEIEVTRVVEEPEPTPYVTVVQALAKGDRGERAVEVLTEIGAARVVPWAATRSVAVWKGERAAKSHRKWQTVASEAAKQARRAWAPVVEPMASTDDVVRRLVGAELAVVLHEDGAVPLADLPVPARDVTVVVGPEGGLTDDELARFAGSGATACHLGTEVLRTSTAGVSAVAALLARTPRWR